MKKNRKKLLQNLALAVVSIFVSLLILEIGLRVIPNNFSRFYSFKYAIDSDIGYISEANQDTQYRSQCYNVEKITTNSLGFRDKEWEDTDEFKIAILGDSFMHALQVEDGQTTADKLEDILDVNVMNAATSGHGTVAEYLVYEKFIQQFKPNIVLLFFLPSNDIRNNHCALEEQGERQIRQACGYIEDGEVKVKQKFAQWSFKEQIKRNCILCSALYEGIKKITQNGIVAHDYSFQSNVFLTDEDQWGESWEITDYAIGKLNQLVKSHGGELIIIPISEMYQVAPEWNTNQLKDIQDFSLPEKKLRSIANEKTIRILSTHEDFIKYKEDNKLEAPYFYYSCDDHYGVLGHELTAKLVADYLIEEKLLNK
jgi:hypothetical protein